MQTIPVSPVAARGRLIELDALRGIAAVLVVLFHYTTRFDELYGHKSPIAFSVPWGHYGVNLFFMISGFVIFMTLQRTRRPMDFVVSRFSRLYPAFWAAVALTFLITHWLGLPGKTVELKTALLNLAMFHSLFGVAHVDGVYWTLEVELLFYAWALAMFSLKQLPRVHLLMVLLFALRLTYFGFEKVFSIDLPWIIYRLLILKYIAWFACGIMIFRLTNGSDSPRKDLGVLVLAVALIGLVESLGVGAMAASFAVIFYLAASGRIPILNNGLFKWLGAISYTLYLLHENIGWAIMLRLQEAAFSANATIAIAALITFLLATVLTYALERPAMEWIRRVYKKKGLRARSGADLAQ